MVRLTSFSSLFHASLTRRVATQHATQQLASLELLCHRLSSLQGVTTTSAPTSYRSRVHSRVAFSREYEIALPLLVQLDFKNSKESDSFHLMKSPDDLNEPLIKDFIINLSHCMCQSVPVKPVCNGLVSQGRIIIWTCCISLSKFSAQIKFNSVPQKTLASFKSNQRRIRSLSLSAS